MFSFVLFSEDNHSSRRENCFSISWTMSFCCSSEKIGISIFLIHSLFIATCVVQVEKLSFCELNSLDKK
jgi:hypothetical protein